MENLVWHYTKMGTLDKIFLPKGGKEYKKGKIRLRFTHIRFLNDPSEGLVFRKFFKDNIKEIANSIKENSSKNLQKDLHKIILNESIPENVLDSGNDYTFSISNLIDSLVFWTSEYAGLDGIAILFKKSDIEELENKRRNLIARDVHYLNLYYEQAANKKEMEEFIKEVVVNIIGNSILAESFNSKISQKEIIPRIMRIFSWFCKQKSWEHEREMRIIIEKPTNTEIIFEGNSVKKYCYESFPVSIVKGIMLGPKCNSEQEKLIKEYLNNNGYKINVERSRAFELLN